MIDSLQFTSGDTFFDIGSGLGLVVMLVNLLTGARCVGIEYDPAYCGYAQSCAQALNLKDVTFIQADARNVNLNTGTIFYLFTPFVNEIFDSVLERLRYTAIRHQIYICAYGTITYDLIKLPWLQIRDPAMEHDFKLAIFTSK
jgi:predicted RNA methylase